MMHSERALLPPWPAADAAAPPVAVQHRFPQPPKVEGVLALQGVARGAQAAGDDPHPPARAAHYALAQPVRHDLNLLRCAAFCGTGFVQDAIEGGRADPVLVFDVPDGGLSGLVKADDLLSLHRCDAGAAAPLAAAGPGCF